MTDQHPSFFLSPYPYVGIYAIITHLGNNTPHHELQSSSTLGQRTRPRKMAPPSYETPLPQGKKRTADETPKAPPRPPPTTNLAGTREIISTVSRKKTRVTYPSEKIPINLNGTKELPPAKDTFQARIINVRIQQDQETRAKWEVIASAAAHLDTALRGYKDPVYEKWAQLMISEVEAALDRVASLTQPIKEHISPATPFTPPQRNTRIPSSDDSPKSKANDIKDGPPENSSAAPKAKSSYSHKPQMGSNPTFAQVASPTFPDEEWVIVTNSKSQPAKDIQHHTAETAPPRKGAPTEHTTRSAPEEDRRVFLRLPQGDPLRSLTCTEARAEVTSKLGLEITDIPRAFPIPTGWALEGKNDFIRQNIITKARSEGWEVDEPLTWFSYVVKDVPKTLRSHNSVRVTNDLIPQEVEGVTGQKPHHISVSQYSNDNDNLQNLIVSFRKPVRPGFRVLGSRPARRIEKKPKVIQCENCLNYHYGKPCTREAKCKTCGKEQHENCSNPICCANCRGPHPYNDLACQARPKVVDGKIQRPSKKQLAFLRQLGEASFKESLLQRTCTELSKQGDGAEEPPDQTMQGTPEASTEPTAPTANNQLPLPSDI